MLRGFLTNLGMLHLVLGEKNLTQLKLQRCQPSKQFCEVGFCGRKKLQTEVWMFDSKMFLVYNEDKKHASKLNVFSL